MDTTTISNKTERHPMAAPNIFDVPFVSRGKACERGDGREIIDEGKVTLTGPFLIVYEKTEFEAGNAEPKLVVNLNFMSAVTMRRFHSAGRNFAGGRIALEGAIDRAFAEKLVMKMELTEYKCMKAALRVALP